MLLAGNPKKLTGYDAAKSAGVSDSQIAIFRDQPEAIAALAAGKIDAFVGTAVDNRALAQAHKRLEAIAHEKSDGGETSVGAFSFNKGAHHLLQAVNEQLRKYLGSADHRARMAKYGITQAEIDSVL